MWRIYEYVSNDERERVLELRRSKSSLDIGEGGEGYIAEDEWCYNCGQRGHWGDVCALSHLSSVI
jgi:protein AIR1/2